jgi:polyhydroxybutyrate depolymerase
MDWGGLERTFVVHRPDTLDPSRSAALLLVLHGGLQTAEDAAEMTRFDDLADREGFVALYPNGVGRSWNAGICCGPAARTGVDDVGFLARLLTDVSAEQNVDPARVYVTGISNGGHMAYRLAVELDGRFAAIAPVAASDLTTASPASPVSVLHIHGAFDQHIPYDGGVGPRSRDPIDYRPVRSVMERWVRINNCRTEPAVRREGRVTRETWSGERADVSLITLEGVGHWWPGGKLESSGRVPPSIDASATIWEFFASHLKR